MKNIEKKENFFGRENELKKLRAIGQSDEAQIVIMYGRRRIGKTELLEQAFRTRHLMKFEGLEGRPSSEQQKQVLSQLAEYVNSPLYTKLQVDAWRDIFKLIAEQLPNGECTIYFEEVQWLACYEETFISDLKFVWDNYFRRHPKLVLILCGSSPSFIVQKVIQSKSLYNRTQHEFLLKEFNLNECKYFFPKKSAREILLAYLTVGGVPEYLKQLNKKSSIFLSLCEASFQHNAYFLTEYQKIFTSSMAKNKYYKPIIEFLAKRRFATRKEIMQHLKINSGGTLTTIFQDLILCGFIQHYAPYHLKPTSTLARYCITDQYLQFYFKFIKPQESAILNGDYDNEPTRAIQSGSFEKWLGFAFERFCRRYHRVIAKILGFNAISYQSGVYYEKSALQIDEGYQLDLIFDRSDNVITLCEIKYYTSPVSARIIAEFNKKLELFSNVKGKTLEKVLICTEGAEPAVLESGYFDRIIDLTELMQDHWWY